MYFVSIKQPSALLGVVFLRWNGFGQLKLVIIVERC
jgi:hypothetical protein